MTAPDASFERDYFEKNYRNYARQNPARKLRFYRGLAERVAPATGATRILDVGCAFGAFLGALDPRWERFGSDVSWFAIERAREATPGATFAAADFGSIPFPGPFDIITSFDVIEHVPSLESVVAAVRSRLRAGGHWIFVVPVYDGPTGPIIRLLDHDETHVHKESRDFWLDWTRRHFILVDWWGVLRYLMPGGWYVHLPTRVARRLTPAIAVIARKET